MRRYDEPLPVRLYRRALVILPRRFRRRCGAGMGAMFADEWRARRWLERGALLASALLDLLWTATIERIDSSEEPYEKGLGMGLRKTGGISWLDFKLGFRMLVRYPGLTVVGGFAMAFAIWVGAGAFEVVTQMVRPQLPLEDGDRIVAIRNWDASAGRVEGRVLHDFVTWREELESVEEIGAYRTLERNLITDDGSPRPVEVAEISASAFGLTRVPALLGRSLVEADEQAGAPPVVVIGYDVWQTRFGGDPEVVGRVLRLGSAQATVVGVMPEGFGFPVFHGVWVPLRLDAVDHERGRGPAIAGVFARLAPGVSLDEARAELTAIGLRTAADYPDTHGRLRPQVMPYAQSITNVSGWVSVGFRSINLFFVMLLVLVCGNVALLMFARAATRESEIVVRSALGASRGRIIAQLFAEALVLAGVAAVVGLAAAELGVRGWLSVADAEAGGRVPFWRKDSLSSTTVLYAAALTVLGAGIAGVVPALKVTGRKVGTHLRQTGGGGGGLRFGGVWTAVIVAQVAVTVAFPATAFFARQSVVGNRSLDVGFPTDEYLSVRLQMDQETPPGTPTDTSQAESLARSRATIQELMLRLDAEPAVIGVTFADKLPRMLHRPSPIEVDGEEPPPESGLGHRVGTASVDVDFFDVLGTPILSGRAFHSGDLGPETGVVIVNQSFVSQVLGGANPVGRRVRYASPPDREPRPWHEIVGVVRDIGMTGNAEGAGLYHPLAPGSAFPVHLAVHVRGDPGLFAPRLQAIASATNETLRLYEIMPFDEAAFRMWSEMAFIFRLLVVVSAMALLLSLAGIYSVLSFTVSQRTREIGVRVALGANPRRIVPAIFRRPLTQIGTGVVAGGVMVAALVLAVLGSLSALEAALVVAYAGLMMGVCMLACIVPTRRALRIEPTEALKADG